MTTVRACTKRYAISWKLKVKKLNRSRGSRANTLFNFVTFYLLKVGRWPLLRQITSVRFRWIREGQENKRPRRAFSRPGLLRRIATRISRQRPRRGKHRRRAGTRSRETKLRKLQCV
jgi:hypothetical protein